MKTGINFLLWTTFVGDEHLPLLDKLKATGFDGVEVPLFEGDAAHYRRLGEAIRNAGLECTASTSVDAATNPISTDPAVRKAAGDRLEQVIEWAAALGSNVLCGPMHSAWKTFTGCGPTEDEKNWCAETLRRAGDAADAADITLMVEPLNRFECYFLNTAADARDLLARTEHPRVKMLYDTHHAHYEEKDVTAAIRGSAAEIGHIHISENDRGTPGAGQVHWPETFASLHAIGFDGWLVIEAFSRLMPDFAAAVGIWRDFFGSPEEVYIDGHRFIREMWAKR